MTKIRTLWDARNERVARGYSRHELDLRERDMVLATHPEIGMLIRKGKPIYYVYRGEDYREASHPAELIEAACMLRDTEEDCA